MLNEVDLAMAHAVERSPRAPWVEIAASLEIDATTAARRWSRLEESGTAWVTCYPPLFRGLVSAIVELKCAKGCAAAVAAEVAMEPMSFFVDVTAGSSDVLVTVGASSSARLAEFVLDALANIANVLEVRTYPVIRIHSQGSVIGEGSIPQAAARRLGEADHRALAFPVIDLDEIDWGLCIALSEDGRRPIAELSAITGASTATVRRRLQKLASEGALRMVVEVAASAINQRVSVWYYARVPARHLSSVTRDIAARPNVKAVASVAAPDNVIYYATFRDLADTESFEQLLNDQHPEIEVDDRKVVLRRVRQLSRLVDADGFAQGRVSIDIR